MGYSDLKIRTQVLLSAGIVAFITVAVIFAVSVGMFASIASQSKTIVSNSLQSQAEEYLLAASTGSADQISSQLSDLEGVVQEMATALQYMFRDSIPFYPVPSYYWWNESTLPPDYTYNARWGEAVSACCSTYYFPESYPENITDIIIEYGLQDYIDKSAHMDTIFPQLTLQNTPIAQLELGFYNRLLRRYPAINISRSRDYDPTARPWYTLAAHQTGLFYSSTPYINSETGLWTLSISQSVFDYATNAFIAVAALEMRIFFINDVILSQKLYQTGYAILVQTDGTVVAGKIWNSATSTTLLNLGDYSPNLWSQIQPLGVAQARQMTVSGQDVFVSQSALISGKYVVIHIVPADEVLATANSISAQDDTTFDRVLGVTAAVGVGTLFIVFLLSTFLAARVTKPIVVVSEIAVKIASNAVKDNVMENISFQKEFKHDDEVGDLARAFKRMITQLSGKPAKNERVIELGDSAIVK